MRRTCCPEMNSNDVYLFSRTVKTSACTRRFRSISLNDFSGRNTRNGENGSSVGQLFVRVSDAVYVRNAYDKVGRRATKMNYLQPDGVPGASLTGETNSSTMVRCKLSHTNEI